MAQWRSNLKNLKIGANLSAVLRELLIVFLGVFAAFWLNDYRNDEVEKVKTKKLYRVIYDDLDRFYQSGRLENENGFIHFFNEMEKERDSLLEIQQIEPRSYISGDYWNLDIIQSLFESGRLADIDPEIYQRLSLLRKNHENFMNFIVENNTYYLNHVTPNVETGANEFFTNEGKLKEKYYLISAIPKRINSYPELLVNWAFEIKEDIKKEYAIEEQVIE